MEWKVVPRALEVAQWLYAELCELSLLNAAAEDCKGGHCQSLGEKKKKHSKMIYVSRSGWDGVNFPTASHMVLCFVLVTGRVLVAPQSRGSAGTVPGWVSSPTKPRGGQEVGRGRRWHSRAKPSKETGHAIQHHAQQ